MAIITIHDMYSQFAPLAFGVGAPRSANQRFQYPDFCVLRELVLLQKSTLLPFSHENPTNVAIVGPFDHFQPRYAIKREENVDSRLAVAF